VSRRAVDLVVEEPEGGDDVDLRSENALLRSIVRKFLAVDAGNWPARNCLRIDLTANEAHLVDTLTKENR
jgi:hypothetical protein